uniref:WRKY domain-containing protein n=1 Tax=Kalanchoe fedtschenkoi TaxID=63787 RepID=A0A7N1A816_KALFE
MSQPNRNPYDPYPYDPFFSSLEANPNASFFSSPQEDPNSYNSNLTGHCNSYITSFNDFVHGGGSVVSSSSMSTVDYVYSNNNGVAVAVAGDHSCNGSNKLPMRHSLSVSSSSAEVVGEEYSGKSMVDDIDHHNGDDDQSKKVRNDKQKKKGAKRAKEPRFAFVTKSEIDQLEDGYRWRKYGQKAVKNSPYPRSYYRCTTQKCFVKKRVERSFQDPSTVITTYEGQHNHHSPATLRGNAAAMLSANAALFGGSSSSLSPGSLSSIPHHPLFTTFNNGQNAAPPLYNYSSYQNPSSKTSSSHSIVPDFGSLQDLVDHPSSGKRESDP